MKSNNKNNYYITPFLDGSKIITVKYIKLLNKSMINEKKIEKTSINNNLLEI